MRRQHALTSLLVLANGMGCMGQTTSRPGLPSTHLQPQSIRPASGPQTLDADQKHHLGAVAFAEAVAGDDDVRFVIAYRSALNLADSLDSSRGSGAEFETTPNVSTRPSTGAENSLWSTNGQSARPLELSESNLASEVALLTGLGYFSDVRRFIIDPDRDKTASKNLALEYTDCVAVGNSNWCCSGTLVGLNVVITAGHCLPSGSRCRVFFGSEVTGTGQVYEGIAHRHRDYRKVEHSIQNDLSVIILDKDVQGVAPRAIATSEAIEAIETAHEDRSIRVAGFGFTDNYNRRGRGTRRAVDVPVVTSNCLSSEHQKRYDCSGGFELVAGSPFLDRDTDRKSVV